MGRRILTLWMIVLFNLNAYSITIYSRIDGNWTDINTWFYTLGGPPCGYIPLPGDTICICAEHTVTISSNITLDAPSNVINIYGTWHFDVGKITLASGSVICLHEDAYITNEMNAGANNRIVIGNTTVLRADDGDQEGFRIFSDGALPVTWKDFSASLESNQVRLYWFTSGEMNNSYFKIEKSEDAVSFRSIGRVEGSNYSEALTGYTFTDHETPGFISYYRIRQMDNDGSFSYSKVIHVYPDASFLKQITLLPNPVEAGADVIIRTGGTSTLFSVLILDINGREVRRMENMQPQNGELFIYGLSGNIQPGIYHVVVGSEQEVYSERLVVR